MSFSLNSDGSVFSIRVSTRRATAAVTAIFKTLDYIPEIDTAPWENNGVADMRTNKPIVRELPKTTLQEGSAELSQVNFAYPTRKTAKIFDRIDLQILPGKVVALVSLRLFRM